MRSVTTLDRRFTLMYVHGKGQPSQQVSWRPWDTRVKKKRTVWGYIEAAVSVLQQVLMHVTGLRQQSQQGQVNTSELILHC